MDIRPTLAIAAFATVVGAAGASAAGCGGPRAAPATRSSPAARYLAISAPANARLDHDVDRFKDDRTSDLASAAAELRDEATTERDWDRQLLGIDFPSPIRQHAAELAKVNEARAALDLRAAGATSLAALAAFGPAQSDADARVEEAARIVRAELGLPPHDTS